MALPQGFDFRSTLAYVTDPANCEFWGPGTAYPTVTAISGYNAGWVTATGNGAANRDAAGDPRLAGQNERSTTNGANDFRFDVPTGAAYDVHLAIGDPAGFASNGQYDLYDGTTLLATVYNGSVSGADTYADASGTVRTSEADWIANEVAYTTASISSHLIFRMTPAAGSNFAKIVHMFIEAAAAGGGGNPYYYYAQQ